MPVRWRRPELVLIALSLCSVLISCGLCWWSLDGIPHVQDEVAYTLQSRVFAAGARWAAPDPAMTAAFWLSQPVSVGGFPPGWPLLLAVGERLGCPWLVNPLLAGTLAPLSFSLARALQLPERAALLSAAVIALSPGVLILEASRMSHTSVLVALLVAAVVVARRPESSLPWWGAGAALAYVVLARQFDAALLGVPLIALGPLRGGWRIMLLPALAALGLLVDNATITGDATVWPVDAWFASVGFPGCNRLGFGEGAGCYGQHTSAAALSGIWSNFKAFDRLLLGVPGGTLVLLVGLLAARRRAWLLVPLLVVGIGYSFYWSVGTAYGARFWHPGYLTVPLLVGIGLDRMLGATSWLALPMMSLWTVFRLGGLEQNWCVDGQVEEQLGDFRGVVVALGTGVRQSAMHPLVGPSRYLLCTPEMEAGDLARLAAPMGRGPLAVRTTRVSRPELDRWLEEEHPDSPVLLAVHDIEQDRRVLIDYATLGEPAPDPDERLFQAWALFAFGDEGASRLRLEGLAPPSEQLSFARLHFLLGDLSLAEELVEQELAEDPSDPEALLLLAKIYRAEGRSELGQQTYECYQQAFQERYL